jgi:hypothetical protein
MKSYSFFRTVILIAGYVFFTMQGASAQEIQKVDKTLFVTENDSGSRHSVHVEILGRTFIFSSINYEYSLSSSTSLGLGLGLMSILAGDIIRNNNGTNEEGRYLDMATTQMIYGNYFIGKRKHKMYFTGGLTNFLITSRNTYHSDKELYRELHVDWNAGLGYQFSSSKTFYRLTAYVVGLPGPSAWFPKNMPWVGLTIGKRF